MPEPTSPGQGRSRHRLRDRIVPWTLAAAALLLATGTLADHLDAGSRRREVLELLDAESLRWLPAETRDELRRESDATWRRLQLARALVSAEMDPAFLAGVRTVEGTEGSLDRLHTARRLAVEALTERPAVWQASMLLGAATYLARSSARDPLLFTAYRDWEAPLELAIERAPGKPEPGRFLAVAYLELWPVVSEEKRRTARALMAEAFRSSRIFHRLVPIWLSVVDDREDAFAPIPPDPGAWSHVETLLAQNLDWPGVVEARRRYRAALDHRRQEDLAEARRRLAGGELADARDLYLRAATWGRPERAAVPVLLHTLAELPPGPAGKYAKALHGWLDWSLDLCLEDRCPLTATALDRLAGLSGEVEPAQAALVAILSGRLADAERLERRSDRLWDREWAPCLLAEARVRVRRGEPELAELALDRIHPSWRERALYWQARKEIASARKATDLAQIEAELEKAGGPLWHAADWRPVEPAEGAGPAEKGSHDRLEIWLDAEEADRKQAGETGLGVDLLAVPRDGAVVEVRLDGAVVATEEVRPGTEVVVRAPLAAGFHRLEIEGLDGRSVVPGRVRRLPSVSATASAPTSRSAALR